MNVLAGAILALSVLATASTASHAGPQPHGDFMAAVRDQSTAPYFVRIRVTNVLANQTLETCVTANLFLGAMHIEHGWSYERRGIEAALRHLDANDTQTFAFSRPSALANMPWLPSPSELADAARLIADTGDASLPGALENGALWSWYQGHPRRHERMAALACALIDRGLKPRQADVSGQLYVER